MDIQQAVAENIHRIRKAQKLSIDRAAELSGVSKSMWGQIERGLANPTVSVLSRVALGAARPPGAADRLPRRPAYGPVSGGGRGRTAAVRRKGHRLPAVPL